MFEAFRCVAPLSSRAGQGPATRATAGSASTASGTSTVPSAKRRRRDTLQSSDNSGSRGAPAALPPPSPQPGPLPAPAALKTGQPQGLAPEKMGDLPLRLVIVGHNPSEHAWSTGHFYSNPSNWMWRILRDTGIAPVPAISGATDDGRMPEVAGVGFTDVGSGTPGTDSSQFSAKHFSTWRPAFFRRMEAQASRASAAIGCTCGRCGAPAVVAFSGKRQFAELFPQQGSGGSSKGGGRDKRQQAGAAAAAAAAAAVAASRGDAGADKSPEAQAAQDAAPAVPLASMNTTCSDSGRGSGAGSGPMSSDHEPELVPTLQARRHSSIATGRQWVLPEGWPLPLSTEVWVMTSTSGAAPMTREQRYAPWQALAERLQAEPWPRQCLPRCRA